MNFWFRPADTLTLGIMRVLTGWMLTYNLLVWGLDLRTFFSSDGVQPLDIIRRFYGNDGVYSFLFYVPDEWLVTVHWSCVAIAFLFCVGLGTRVTSILAWVITISYSQRVPVANFGLDQILGLLCMYLAIGPSGDSLSIDSWLRKRFQKRRLANAPPVKKKASAGMALRLIQIHVCVIYFWAGFAKLKGDSWWTGEAMWQVIANQEYQTLDLTWMASVPWLPYLIAHVTVAWEVFFCVLVWVPFFRPWMLLMGTCMHVGIGAFMGMWTFGLIMTFAYFSFSDPQRWRHLLGWTTGAASVVADNPLLRSEVRSRTETISPVSPEAVQSKVSASSEQCLPQPPATVLVISTDADERQSLRHYLREHDIPCRATFNVELGLQIGLKAPPAVVLLSGTKLSAKRLATMLDDLTDGLDTMVVVMVTPKQRAALGMVHASVQTLSYPVSFREIRTTLTGVVLGDQNNSRRPEESGHPSGDSNTQVVDKTAVSKS